MKRGAKAMASIALAPNYNEWQTLHQLASR